MLIAAAVALGQALAQLGVDYAVIGGVACVILGSTRTTRDLDFVVDVLGHEVRGLKARIAAVDPRFESSGNSLRFSGNDFPIELLPTDSFTWPQPLRACTIRVDNGTTAGPVEVLSPAAILFSKAKRLCHSMDSTRPMTVAKAQSDSSDMTFLLSRASPDDFREVFSLYAPQKQDGILQAIRAISTRYPQFATLGDILRPS